MARKEEMSKIISLEEKKLESIDNSILKTNSMIENAKKTIKENQKRINQIQNSTEEDEINFIKDFNLHLETILHSSKKLLKTLLKIKSRRIN
jgi:peptidoglycan hydrolase CwlO-like protein